MLKNIKFCMLFVPIASFAQIGINTFNPTESLDANVILRLRDLPSNLSTNAISTFSDGSASSSKNQTFNAVNTAVTDANGVVGIVEGLPITKLPEYKTISYIGSTTIIDANVQTNSLTQIGNLAIYLEANPSNLGNKAHVRFSLINGVSDNVVVNQLKQGTGGIYGTNQTFTAVTPNPNPYNNLAPTVVPYNSSDQTVWHQINQFSIQNYDFIQYMISFINKEELYRLSGVVNPTISANANQPASSATVTFFIELLTN